jgi:hypothetical protein
MVASPKDFADKTNNKLSSVHLLKFMENAEFCGH